LIIKLKTFVKSILIGRFIKINSFEKYFDKKKLIIADIGSTGGLSPLWVVIKDLISCYAFDPDSRSVLGFNKGYKNYNHALWSSKSELSLHLTKFPDASSIYPPNLKFLKQFLNFKDHEVEKKVKIKAKKMDDIDFKKNNPDFIKVDTEGADLDIIKGAQNNIKNNCIGLQIEVQFVERNLGSPLFGEIHEFLIKNGFWIMDLKKESWIRKNSIYKVNSKPQLIWGDAIYMLSSEMIIKKGSKIPENERVFFLLKIILISLVYGFHDYAFQIIDNFREKKLIETEKYLIVKNILKKNIKSNIYIIFTKFLLIVFASLAVIFLCLFKNYRNKALNFWKVSVIGFSTAIINLLSRTGRHKESVGETSF